MAQYIQEAEVDEQIQEIIKKPMTKRDKISLIKSIKQSSMAQRQKASSFQTILSISNSMVGTSTLVFPVMFYQSGVLDGILVAIVVGLISCKTTQLLVIHNKQDEADLPDTLNRALGLKWKNIFNISNVTLLWASGIIYLILICNQLYPLMQSIADLIGISNAKLTDITFSKVSYQWIGVLFTILVTPLLIQKKLGLILKLIPFGVISVMMFIIFTIFKGTKSLVTDFNKVVDNVQWITSDIGTLAGTFGLALLIQSLIIPIVKNNQVQANNVRDIGLGYLWTWFVYCMAGSFGAFAIATAEKQDGTSGSTLLDYYYSKDISIIIIQILLFLQLSVVYPVLQFITRSQFFGLVYPLREPPAWAFYGFTAFYALSCLLIQCLEVDLTLIISLCGAVIGLMQEYIIPITLHLYCLYGKKRKVEDFQRINRSDSSDALIDNVDLSQFPVEEEELKCNDHTILRQKYPKQLRFGIYGLIIAIGMVICIAKLIEIVNG